MAQAKTHSHTNRMAQYEKPAKLMVPTGPGFHAGRRPMNDEEFTALANHPGPFYVGLDCEGWEEVDYDRPFATLKDAIAWGEQEAHPSNWGYQIVTAKPE